MLGTVMSTILREKIIQVMQNKYGNRKPDIIYVHMFDSTVFTALNEKRQITNSMIVGEIIHQGAENVLEPAETKCKKVYLSNTDRMIQQAVERFVKYENEKPYVEICGTADGFYNGYPIELKTTRIEEKLSKPNEEWIRRGKIYAWLYDTKKAYIIVLNVITGEEANHEVQPYTNEEIQEIVEKWLRGEYPHPTLTAIINNTNKTEQN